MLAGIAYRYPWYVATHHAAADDRYDFVLLFAFPFYFIRAAIAGLAFYQLMKAVIRGKCGGADVTFAICGGALMLMGSSPLLLMVGRRMYSISIGN